MLIPANPMTSNVSHAWANIRACIPVADCIKAACTVAMLVWESWELMQLSGHHLSGISGESCQSFVLS